MLHSSTTLSKNIVPELDARIKVYSQYLVQLTESSPYSLTVCCHLAAAKTNNTIGKLGKTPAEIFTGRGWRDGKQLNIDITSLTNELKRKREKRRLYDDRKNAERYQKKELQFVPYSDPDLNSPLVNNPSIMKLKVGDKLTLKEPYNKNEPRYIYRILNIDFRMKTVKIIRESMQETVAPKPKIISFQLIDRIFPHKDLFGRFDGYDLNINCSYSEWDNFVSKIESERSKIRPLNLSGQPDFHRSLCHMMDDMRPIKYVGHQSHICQIEI